MFLNDFMFGLSVLVGGMLLAAIPAYFAAKAVGNFLREKYSPKTIHLDRVDIHADKITFVNEFGQIIDIKEGEAKDGSASNSSN